MVLAIVSHGMIHGQGLGYWVGAYRESNWFRPTPAPSRMFGESRGEICTANM